MNGLFLLLLLGAAPGVSAAEKPAAYAPEDDRAALRADAAGLTAAVDRLAGLPLEKERVGALASALDEAQGRALRARADAEGLEGAAGGAAAELGAIFKGGGGEAGVEKRLEDLGRDRAAETGRLARLSARRRELEDALKKKKEPPKEKDRIMDLLKAAEESLGRAEGALRGSERNDPLLRECRDRMKDELRRALSAFGELAASLAGVRARGEQFTERSPGARAAFGSLGRAPEAEFRTRAWEKLDLLRDSARGLFLSADSGLNRESDFAVRREAFLRQRTRFEAGLKEARAALEEAKGLLDGAARLVNEAAAY